MMLKEMKLRTLSLIEEVNPNSELLTDDVDIQAKINYVIDMKQNELARIKKIAALETMKVQENDQIDLQKDISNFYKLSKISGVDFDIFDNIVIFKEDGEVSIYYWKYPKMITTDTKDDEYKFELSTDVLEIMPLGVAADLLKSDISAQYGQVYEKAYQNALNMLDINVSNTKCKIVGGIDV